MLAMNSDMQVLDVPGMILLPIEAVLNSEKKLKSMVDNAIEKLIILA